MNKLRRRRQLLKLLAALASLVWLACLAGPVRANLCGLPVGAAAGAGLLTSSAKTSSLSQSSHTVTGAFVSIGLLGGVMRSTNVYVGVGLQNASVGAYTCFMSTDMPLAVSALPGTNSTLRLVPSPGQAMTLEWTNSAGPLPVTYNVLFGTTPNGLSQAASSLQATSDPMTNLNFQTPYYWQVSASDEFGRTALSDVYSFSIVPLVTQLIAAPNPMHPGHGPTTFLFDMPGQGSAELQIFSLPDGRKIFDQTFGGLQDGANTIVYDGRENDGRYLPNGVYTVRLMKSGVYGNATELFKLVSAR